MVFLMIVRPWSRQLFYQDIISTTHFGQFYQCVRWLPQMLYYFIAYQTHRKIVINPWFGRSKGIGNICAGMMGQQMASPIDHFIACTNVNDVVPATSQTKYMHPNHSAHGFPMMMWATSVILSIQKYSAMIFVITTGIQPQVYR